MRQFPGIAGLLTTIKDTNLRAALQRLEDHARETGAAITSLSQNKSADSAQIVVARQTVPQSNKALTGDEVVTAFRVNDPTAVGSITDVFSTKPAPGNLIVYAFVKEIANAGAGIAFTVTIEYGYNGAAAYATVIDGTLLTGGILTGVTPIYSDGSIPIAYATTTGASVEYDFQLNIVAV